MMLLSVTFFIRQHSWLKHIATDPFQTIWISWKSLVTPWPSWDTSYIGSGSEVAWPEELHSCSRSPAGPGHCTHRQKHQNLNFENTIFWFIWCDPNFFNFFIKIYKQILEIISIVGPQSIIYESVTFWMGLWK